MALVAGAVLLAASVGACAIAGEALVVSAPVENPDAILSLASHEWERLPEAARWAARYPHARVVLSEPLKVNRWNCHLCPQRVGWLQQLGVSKDRIDFLPRKVYRTYDEATSALEYVRKHGAARLLVVTSPYHTRRTLLSFRKVFRGSGVEAGVVPATATSPAAPGTWWLHRYDRSYVMYEWSGILFYWWKFGVRPGLAS